MRLGLLEHRWEPIDPDAPHIPNLLWKQDLNGVLGMPIWDYPNLTFTRCRPYATSDVLPNDIIPCEGLIWATNGKELRQMRGISGSLKPGGDYTNGEQSEHDHWILSGLSVRIAQESGSESRHIGIQSEDAGNEGHQQGESSDLNIDGAGGERITSIMLPAEHESPVAIKVTKACLLSSF